MATGIELNQDETTGATFLSKEGWQERALARVASRHRKTSRSTKRQHGIYLFMDDPLKILLDEAAHRRGISMNGYARRAVAAMIAHDLGMEFTDVCQHMALPMNYERVKPPNWNKYPRNDTGEDYGDWRITGLE